MSKTYFDQAVAGELRRPLFEPAVYEHKAALLGIPVAELCRSGEKIVEATLLEVEIYRPDAVTVGADVYNVEAEALGARVNYDVGHEEAPAIAEPVLASVEDWHSLRHPDPWAAGRMPLFLDAARRVRERVPQEVVVRGAVSGPFSLAATLCGFEALLMTLLDDLSAAAGLLEFCTEVVLTYGLAFVECGVEPVYFDSRCAPPLLSPEMYEQFVLPLHRRLVRATREAGAGQVALIIGGDTTPIADLLVRAEADYLLCDAPADFHRFRELAEEHGFFLRRNLDPVLVERGDREMIERAVRSMQDEASGMTTFVLGTGVLSYRTQPETVRFIRKLLDGA